MAQFRPYQRWMRVEPNASLSAANSGGGAVHVAERALPAEEVDVDPGHLVLAELQVADASPVVCVVGILTADDRTMSTIWLGTAGWSYLPDWSGSFYPLGTGSSDALERYFQAFRFVEVSRRGRLAVAEPPARTRGHQKWWWCVRRRRPPRRR